MASQVAYHEFQDPDFNLFLEMGLKLWTDFEREELQKLLLQTVQSDKQMVWIAKIGAETAGFVIFSIRTDYVEGALQSPTGYLEGIFVEDQFRKLGIAKKFMELGEAWCKSKGCCQIGSDTWLTDTESRSFHKKVGFWEEDELVHFLKDI